MSRKIDALVAEHVMGWEPFDVTFMMEGGLIGYPKEPFDPYTKRVLCPPNVGISAIGIAKKGFEVIPEVPHYSSSIADAWEVVGKFDFMQLITGPQSEAGKNWACQFADNSSQQWVFAESPSMAICLAALKAKNVEIPEDDR